VVSTLARLERDLHTTTASDYDSVRYPLPLLATGARKARGFFTCAVCRQPVRPGDRVCDLVPSGAAAHVAGCAARAGAS
jgi:hypothetical protein